MTHESHVSDSCFLFGTVKCAIFLQISNSGSILWKWTCFTSKWGRISPEIQCIWSQTQDVKITHQTVDRPIQPGQDNVLWIHFEIVYIFDVSHLVISYTESNICNCLKI